MRLRKTATTFGLAALLAAVPLASLPAAARTDNVGPHNPYCGAWQGDTWVPNGNCTEETTTTTTTATNAMPPPAQPEGRSPARINGTITSVKGHLVTLQQSTRSLVINDERALDDHTSGRVAVGRQVAVHGYWEGGTFYVTRFEDMPH